jgi:SAM-dependent methyltransferase
LTAHCFSSYADVPLAKDGDGIWHSAKSIEAVSYPPDGSRILHAVEDDSWWFVHRNRVILSCMRRFPPPGDIWDIGGGNGFVSAMLARHGFGSILLEAGLDGCRNARRRGVANVLRGTFESLRLRRGSLPAAGLFDVLEHSADPAAFLGSLHAALQDGGRLYLTVPAHPWLWSDEDDWAGHAVRFRKQDLLALLSGAGFSVLYHSFFFSFLSPAIFLLRVLPGRLGVARRRRRDERRDEMTRKVHRTPPGWAGGIWEKHLTREAGRIGSGTVVTHGSSLLAVGEKSRHQ